MPEAVLGVRRITGEDSMSRLKSDYEVATVLESEMTVDAAEGRIFNEALIDHIIKFAHEDPEDLRADDLEPRRIRYRVVIEVADVEMDAKMPTDGIIDYCQSECERARYIDIAVRDLPSRMRQEAKEVNGPHIDYDDGYEKAKEEDATVLEKIIAEVNEDR